MPSIVCAAHESVAPALIAPWMVEILAPGVRAQFVPGPIWPELEPTTSEMRAVADE
jgi:hypothetical protein